MEGCPRGLGCAIVLRGGSSDLLAKIKEIVTELVFRSYNWKLQLAYKLDRCIAMKNTPGDMTSKARDSSNQNPFEKEGIFDAYEDDTVKVGTCIMRLSDQLKSPRVEQYRVHGTIGVDNDGMPLDENYASVSSNLSYKRHTKQKEKSQDYHQLVLNADTSLGSFLITRFSEVIPPKTKTKHQQYQSGTIF